MKNASNGVIQPLPSSTPVLKTELPQPLVSKPLDIFNLLKLQNQSLPNSSTLLNQSNILRNILQNLQLLKNLQKTTESSQNEGDKKDTTDAEDTKSSVLVVDDNNDN